MDDDDDDDDNDNDNNNNTRELVRLDDNDSNKDSNKDNNKDSNNSNKDSNKDIDKNTDHTYCKTTTEPPLLQQQQTRISTTDQESHIRICQRRTRNPIITVRWFPPSPAHYRCFRVRRTRRGTLRCFPRSPVYHFHILFSSI